MGNLLDSAGFNGRYRFVYLPMNFTSGGCLGYADALMNSPVDALELLQKLQGFQLQNAFIETSWCDDDRQDLEDLITRYRDSPVMHRSVPESHRPALFENGLQVKFPVPTRP